MSHPVQEIRILHRGGIYPNKYGGNLRTLNIARLTMGIFEQTTIFSLGNSIEFEGNISGVTVIQEKELSNVWQRYRYYLHAMTAKEVVIPYMKRAFVHPEDCLFQIEDPRFFPLLKKNHISRFILDEQNVNWERYDFPQIDLKQNVYAKMVYRREKENEKQALLHAAHVLCCSSRDRNILADEVPEIENRISVIPNCVNLHEFDNTHESTDPWKNSPEKGRILFIGLMAYPPNTEAAQLICNSIAPQNPDLDFLIIGKNPPKVVYPENVRFLGYVDDVIPVMAGADICLAPIRSGSGTRIKILEYMAMGKPVISTSKGAEGIECTNGLNIIIEDSIEKYPEIIRELLDNEKKRAALGREARKLISGKYDWELYRDSLKKIYLNILHS